MYYRESRWPLVITVILLAFIAVKAYNYVQNHQRAQAVRPSPSEYGQPTPGVAPLAQDLTPSKPAPDVPRPPAGASNDEVEATKPRVAESADQPNLAIPVTPPTQPVVRQEVQSPPPTQPTKPLGVPPAGSRKSANSAVDP